MIEIKLIGEDALQYIQNEKTGDAQYSDLLGQVDVLRKTNINLITSLAEVVAKYNDLKDTTASSKVVRDTELVKDIVKPSFATSTKLTEIVPTTGSYSLGDLALIEARMKKPSTNQDRSLKNIAGALGRHVNPVRSKLLSMDIVVRQGMCYYKD